MSRPISGPAGSTPNAENGLLVVVREEGDDWWYCDGIKIGGFHLGGSQLGLRFVAPAQMTDTGKAEDVIPGAYIPDERLKDMDADGVYGEIIYPTVGFLLYKVPDTELLDAICCAYNDWLAEFCRPFPHRIKGVAMLNTDDVAAAVREMERCVGMGLSGAMISVYPPEGRGYYSPEYEPLWAAAQDLGVPLSLHVASNRAAPGTPGAFSSTHFDRVNADHWVRQSLSHMVLGGVFERHPKLRVGSVGDGTLVGCPFLGAHRLCLYPKTVPKRLPATKSPCCPAIISTATCS